MTNAQTILERCPRCGYKAEPYGTAPDRVIAAAPRMYAMLDKLAHHSPDARALLDEIDGLPSADPEK